MENVDFKRFCVETGIFRKNKVNNMVDDALAADVAKSLEIMLLILQGIRIPKAMECNQLRCCRYSCCGHIRNIVNIWIPYQSLSGAVVRPNSMRGSLLKRHRHYMIIETEIWYWRHFDTSTTCSRHCDNFLYSHWRRFRHSGAVKRIFVPAISATNALRSLLYLQRLPKPTSSLGRGYLITFSQKDGV